MSAPGDKRVRARIPSDWYARLEALCVRPIGVARPSRATVLRRVILLGIDRAEREGVRAQRRRAKRVAGSAS